MRGCRAVLSLDGLCWQMRGGRTCVGESRGCQTANLRRGIGSRAEAAPSKTILAAHRPFYSPR